MAVYIDKTGKRRKTLHLHLKKKWYDMIDSGVKTEEYREMKPYWESRLECANEFLYCNLNCRHCKYQRYDVVMFFLGYTYKNMVFEIEYINRACKGNPEWGAPKDELVYKIKLGKRLE